MSATTTPAAFLLPAQAFAAGGQVRRVLGETPFRTDADVLAVAFDAGGLWSLEEGGTLRQWDLASGRQRSWHALGQDETLWSFRPDGRVLAGASVDLTLWDVATGQQRGLLPQHSWVTALAFAPGSDFVATGHDDGLIRLWDTADGQMVRQFRGYLRPVSALAFSPDGKRLLSAGEDKLIYVWNVATGEIDGLLGGHTDRIPAVAWHPDGRRLISAGWDTTARVWDAETFEPIILLNGHASQVVALAVSPDGALLACADSANAIHLWDLASYEPLHVFHDAEAEVRCLAFNADGMRLAAGGADRLLHLWDAPRGQYLGGRSEACGLGTSVSVSPDGEHVASAQSDKLRIWDAESGALLREQNSLTEVRRLAHSPDGSFLAVAGDSVALHAAASGERLRMLDGPKPPVVALAFAADSTLLAAGGPASADVWLWDARTGDPTLVIPDAVPGCVVQALAFHPCRPLLAVGGCDWYETTGGDGFVILWDVPARRREALLGGGAAAVVFDPSGSRLAVAGLDRTIRVWDLQERRLVGEWTGHSGAVRCLACSPDGRWIASAGDDHTLRLWDAHSGNVAWVASLPAQATSLQFAPDGRSLFTGNGNGSCSQIAL